MDAQIVNELVKNGLLHSKAIAVFIGMGIVVNSRIKFKQRGIKRGECGKTFGECASKFACLGKGGECPEER